MNQPPARGPLARALPMRRPPTKLETGLIHAALLPTWQTAAAIAQHAGVPARTAVAVLKRQSEDWQLEVRTARIDGHNEVHMFRLRKPVKLVQVMGVAMPIPIEKLAEEVD